jgi:hypothetical protein
MCKKYNKGVNVWKGISKWEWEKKYKVEKYASVCEKKKRGVFFQKKIQR